VDNSETCTDGAVSARWANRDAPRLPTTDSTNLSCHGLEIPSSEYASADRLACVWRAKLGRIYDGLALIGYAEYDDEGGTFLGGGHIASSTEPRVC
jgi:hypothetical protein